MPCDGRRMGRRKPEVKQRSFEAMYERRKDIQEESSGDMGKSWSIFELSESIDRLNGSRNEQHPFINSAQRLAASVSSKSTAY